MRQGALLAVMILGAGGAAAHDAPSGWAYPLRCCSNRDCHVLPITSVKAARDGLYHLPDGRTYSIPMSEASPDSDFHICETDTGHILCFFAPGSGT